MIFLWGWMQSGESDGSDGFPSAPPSQVSGSQTTHWHLNRKSKRNPLTSACPVPRCDWAGIKPVTETDLNLSYQRHQNVLEIYSTADAAFTYKQRKQRSCCVGVLLRDWLMCSSNDVVWRVGRFSSVSHWWCYSLDQHDALAGVIWEQKMNNYVRTFLFLWLKQNQSHKRPVSIKTEEQK